MRVVGTIVLAGLIGVATGLLLERVLLGVLVAAVILVAGLVILISRSEPPPSEPLETPQRSRGRRKL
jgi:hypothetical protein